MNKLTYYILFIFCLLVVHTSGQDIKKDTSKVVHLISTSDGYDSQNIAGKELSEFIDKEYPNSIPIPGTNIRFAIGGFIKADAIFDIDYIGDASEFYTGSIPLKDSDESKMGGKTSFHLRETRLSLDFRSKTTKGTPMRAFVDVDFFDSDAASSSYKLRLRNAAMTYGNLLIGQYWTTIMDLAALPTTIDFEIGDGVVFNRTPQIRWEQALGSQFKWAVALENPSASIDNPNNIDGQVLQYIPNTVARISWNHAIGHMQLAASSSNLRWVNSTNFNATSIYSYGVNFTGSLRFAKEDKFMWGLNYGEGWGQNIAGMGSGSDAVLNSNGILETFPCWAANASIEHYWISNLASTFACSWGETLSPQNRSQDLQEIVATYHVNLRWGVSKLFIVGIEYMGGYRKIVSGQEGLAQRVQLAARLNFN